MNKVKGWGQNCALRPESFNKAPSKAPFKERLFPDKVPFLVARAYFLRSNHDEIVKIVKILTMYTELTFKQCTVLCPPL